MKAIDTTNLSTQQLNTKKTQQNNLLSTQTIVKNAKESFGDGKSDIISLQHLNYAKSDNVIKVIDLSDNQQAHLIYSTLNSKISANIVTKNGDVLNVKTENLPNELQQIKSVEVFNKFLENSHLRVSILSDNEPKLYIRQRGYGGGGNQSTGGGGTGHYTSVSKDQTCPVGTIQVSNPHSRRLDAFSTTCEYTINGLISAKGGISAGDHSSQPQTSTVFTHGAGGKFAKETIINGYKPDRGYHPNNYVNGR